MGSYCCGCAGNGGVGSASGPATLAAKACSCPRFLTLPLTLATASLAAANHPPAGTAAGAAPPPETLGTGVSASGSTRCLTPLLSGVSALLLLVAAFALGAALAAGTGVGSGVGALGALGALAGVAGTGVGSGVGALGTDGGFTLCLGTGITSCSGVLALVLPRALAGTGMTSVSPVVLTLLGVRSAHSWSWSWWGYTGSRLKKKVHLQYLLSVFDGLHYLLLVVFWSW